MTKHGWLLAATACLLGCGGNEDRPVHAAGQKVGETAVEFVAGLGQGIDRQMVVVVDLSPDVTELGLQKTMAKALTMEQRATKGMSIYFIADKAVKTALLAKALNADGVEIGRAAVDIELAEDEARYVNFVFDPQTDMQLVAKYVVGLKKPAKE